jgi:hypothetical protein
LNGRDATPDRHPARRHTLTGTVIDIVTIPDLLADPERIADAPGIAAHPEHSTHSLDDIVGYVVRRTLQDGTILPARAGRVGDDAMIFVGGNSYATAMEITRAMRFDGRYAVVDSVYSCGCRS